MHEVINLESLLSLALKFRLVCQLLMQFCFTAPSGGNLVDQARPLSIPQWTHLQNQSSKLRIICRHKTITHKTFAGINRKEKSRYLHFINS